MTVYLDDGRWRYRSVIRLLDGTKRRVSGTPKENTKEAAEAAEERHARGEFDTPEVAPRSRYIKDLAEAADARIYLLNAVNRKTLSTNQLGAASEAHVISDLIEAGYYVSVASGSPRYDLVVEFPSGELKKVQVKTGKILNDWLRFNAYSVVPRTKTEGPKHRKYTVDEADYFAVYSPELNASFLIPNTGNTPGSLHLKLGTAEAERKRIYRKNSRSAVAQEIEQPSPKGLVGGASPSGATERSESLDEAPDSAQSSCVTSPPPVV